jgi:hypothetical protein
MTFHHETRVDTTVLDAAALHAIAMGGREAGPAWTPRRPPARITTPAPVGAWRSADGAVRLDIRTDGTYDGQVAGRRRRARGTYRFDGATMTLSDDSGLNTAVTLDAAGGLEMAGHRLARR